MTKALVINNYNVFISSKIEFAMIFLYISPCKK